MPLSEALSQFCQSELAFKSHETLLPKVLQDQSLQIIATGKERLGEKFNELYRLPLEPDEVAISPIRTSLVNPETVRVEPRVFDTRVAAVFKIEEVQNVFLHPYWLGFLLGDPERNFSDYLSLLNAAIYSGDVVFIGPENERWLKPDLNPDSPDYEARYQQEVERAQSWYSREGDAIAYRWLISFAVTVTSPGQISMKRLTTLEVNIKFVEPLNKEYVKEKFNPHINALIPLVEAGLDHPAEFTVKTGYMDEAANFIPTDTKLITQALAYQLVVQRFLPPALLAQLTQELPDSYDQEFQNGWQEVRMDLNDLPVLQSAPKPLTVKDLDAWNRKRAGSLYNTPESGMGRESTPG